MSEPILVVDPGTVWTKAAIVANANSQVLKEPSSGSHCWPTAVALDGEVLRVGTIAEKRRRSNPLLYADHLTGSIQSGNRVTVGNWSYPPDELLAALLGALKAEAERLLSAPVGRILILASDGQSPATTAGTTMIAAAAAAGFADVELLFLPAAVTMAAAHSVPAPPGGLVLVCDAGASALRLTLVQTEDGQVGEARARAAVSTCGGDNLDALLSEALRKNAKWLKPLLTAEQGAGERATIDLADLVRRVRHELSDADQAEDALTPVTPIIRFTRQDLERIMRHPLGQLSAACKGMVGEAGSRGGISGVAVVGGCARTPIIQRALSGALACPVTILPTPEFAALRGGCEWAGSAASRRVPSTPIPVGLQALTWEIPGGAARMIGWNTASGQAHEAGQSLARIRTEDDAIWDLAAGAPGIFEQACAASHAIVATGDVLAVIRQTSVGPSERRPSPLRLAVIRGGQFATFSHDSRQLATLDADGTLRITDAETTAELAHFKVNSSAQPRSLDAVMRQDGHWLAAFFDGSAVIVLELATGRQMARIAKGDDPKTVQFSSNGLLLCTGEAKRVRIWSSNGRELLALRERVVSGEAVAMSRDGRWLAWVSRAGLEVRDRTTHSPVVRRPMPRFTGQVRHLAFSSEPNRLLLAVDSQMEMIALPTGASLWAIDVPAPVRAADFAPDDKLVATTGHPPQGSSVWIRDASTGIEVDRIPSADGTCGCVRFSPDGRFLVSSVGDNAVLWALTY